jgi:hypothetical protein
MSSTLSYTDVEAVAFAKSIVRRLVAVGTEGGVYTAETGEVALLYADFAMDAVVLFGAAGIAASAVHRLAALVADPRLDRALFEELCWFGLRDRAMAEGSDSVAAALAAEPEIARALWGGEPRDTEAATAGALKLVLRRSVALDDDQLRDLVDAARRADEGCRAALVEAARKTCHEAVSKIAESGMSPSEFLEAAREAMDEQRAALAEMLKEAPEIAAEAMEKAVAEANAKFAREDAIDRLLFAGLPPVGEAQAPSPRP